MKKILSVLLVSSAISLGACSAPAPRQEAQSQAESTTQSESSASEASQSEAAAPGKISAERAYEMINSGEELVILDVRNPDEYEAAHIPGSYLLPLGDISDDTLKLFPVADTKFLIYCRSGNRSAQAMEKLNGLGYTNVYDFGGINDWPYETESGAWEPAQKSASFSSFSTNSLSGAPLDESVFKGHKLTMVNIWATFCGPCLREMPELGEINAEYAEKGIQVVGLLADISYTDKGNFDAAQIDNARNLVEKTGANYIHLLPSEDLIRAKLAYVSSVPETIFVDENGNQVGDSYIGSRSGNEWKLIIDSLLKEM